MSPNSKKSSGELDFLCVDAFMRGAVEAKALATALELGLIDFIHERKACTKVDLQTAWQGDYRGLNLLLDLLKAGRIIVQRRGAIGLSRQFVQALRYRDLLEAKLQFANWVSPDLTDLFTDLIRDPGLFQQRARMFRLFRYDRSRQATAENMEFTKRWMHVTSTLTRYESPVCMNHHDFSRYRRILDVGGNSGEFVLQVCRRFNGIQAVVFDLPVVCQVGREHIRNQPEADRISFVEGDALRDVLPQGFDLVIFKSMLHDWPDDQAGRLIAGASKALAPGGELLVFERGPLEVGRGPLPHSMLPFLLLFRSFRSPELYVQALRSLGFDHITIEKIELETAFHLLVGRKADAV